MWSNIFLYLRVLLKLNNSNDVLLYIMYIYSNNIFVRQYVASHTIYTNGHKQRAASSSNYLLNYLLALKLTTKRDHVILSCLSPLICIVSAPARGQIKGWCGSDWCGRFWCSKTPGEIKASYDLTGVFFQAAELRTV